MKTFKQMLKMIEEAENDPNMWLSEGFEFVQIDHVPDKQLNEAGGGYKMIKWTAKGEGEGPVRVTDEVQRRKMLEQGWRDVLKIEKYVSDSEYTQAEIDPRFYDDYKAQGYKKGWTNYCIAKDGKRKYVKPKAHSKWLAKGWHDYDCIKIHKETTGKDGKPKFDITFIDSAEFPKYEAEGWKMGWKHDDAWEKSFSIQTSNSKLGKHVANFSLTPVTSCPKGVPCASDGCYARKCYMQYPAAQAAWDHNFELLKAPDGPKRLEEDVNNFLKTKGKGLTKFRWHVAGDLIDAGHLAAICNIAKSNDKVLFWLYTKNYDLVADCNPPSNLVIILSAWNDYELEKIESLHKKFPVAYLDDWDHKDLIPKDEDAFICPCADDRVGDMVDDKHCETCKTHSERHGKMDTHPCYMLKPGESLIFRKH